MASASRSAQELRKPFPAWYGEQRTSTQQLWCAYHADGQGAWLGRAASFGRLSGVEAGALARRACTECKDVPALPLTPQAVLYAAHAVTVHGIRAEALFAAHECVAHPRLRRRRSRPSHRSE